MGLTRRPGPVAKFTVEPGAHSVVSGTRACAVAMSDAVDVMQKNSAPEGFEGDPAELAHHAMTSTAADLATATTALQTGVAALDRFCDRLDSLRSIHTHLLTRRHSLGNAAAALGIRENAAAAASDASLAGDIDAHNVRIAAFDADVQDCEAKVTAAENQLIAALKKVDTIAEARVLTGKAPNIPKLLDDVKRIAADSGQVLAWWGALSRAEREALKIAHPEIIGNLDGIPVVDRDEANRASLSALYNTLTQRKADGELTVDRDKDLLDKANAMHAGLKKADDQKENGEPIEVFLLGFDPDAAHGDGHAAIAFGNPDTADHVSANVPGLSSTMNNFDGVSGDAARVREMAAHQGNGSVASIAWLGYDAPDFDLSQSGIQDGLGVAGESRANAGAKNLSHFIDGLRDTRPGPPAHLTVVGHSYGSVTVAKAAGHDMAADDIVLVGNPGVGAENSNAKDLRGHVYVGSSDEDPVTHLGGTDRVSLGPDAAAEDFSATRFRVDPQGEFNLSSGGVERGVENHTSYFDDAKIMADEGRGSHDSASLISVGKIVAGHGGDVEKVDGRTDTNQAWWIKQAGSDAKDAGVNWFKNYFLHRGD